MATSVIFNDGDQLEVPVIAGTVSGDPVVFGNQPGVALVDRGTDGNATVKFSGVIEVELDVDAGDPVYIGTADYALSASEGAGDVFFGVAINDADADDMVRVRIGGIAPASGS